MSASSATISSPWARRPPQGLAKAIGEEGEIGFLYFDANAYVVNQRDAAFRTTIEKEFPKIKIAATQGFSDPARAFQIASAMILQHPKLKAIYAPWAEPAAGVLQAIRTAHRTDIAVGTMDLSNTVAVSLVQGGAVKALTVDDPYTIGKSLVARDRLCAARQDRAGLYPGAGDSGDQGQHPGRLCEQLPRRAAARGHPGAGQVRPALGARLVGPRPAR